jgi:hypothetical protein
MATDQGSLSFAFIQSEIAKGEDVEIDIRYRNGGRHYVEVAGAGTILGVPWITHVADQHQDNNAAGTDPVQFDFVLNGDQRPMEGNGAIIDQVISETELSEPSTVVLFGARTGCAGLVETTPRGFAG